jgi:hypothetical protein
VSAVVCACAWSFPSLSLLGFRLYSREHFAVLLLSSIAGVHAFRIDSDGSVKPFEVSGTD